MLLRTATPPNDTPPPLLRPRKREREEEETTQDDERPPPPEPANGMAVGVTTVHPLQPFLPLCFKTDETLASPWKKPPKCSTPDLPGHPTLLLFMLDLSASMAGAWMADTSGGDPHCAAHAVVGLLRKLPDYLKKTLSPAQFATTSLAIAGFSGTAGWASQSNCGHESVAIDETRGNWVSGANIATIDENAVPISDEASLLVYLQRWIEKTERIYVPSTRERDVGRGTNLEAALFFAHKVVEEYCNVHGGAAQVFVATDGQPTVGETSAVAIRATLDRTLFDEQRGHAVPIQTHALILGNDVEPKTLTDLLGSRGLLGYAKDSESIEAGLDSIFKIPFAEGKGTFDFVTLVSFEDVETGERVSEHALTLYSQGQLVGDNYTALYGARLPNKFRSPAASLAAAKVDADADAAAYAAAADAAAADADFPFSPQHAPAASGAPRPPGTEEEASKLVLRVVGLCAPNLADAVASIRAAARVFLSPAQLLNMLLDQGHEVLLDKRLPLSLEKWWSPAPLRGTGLRLLDDDDELPDDAHDAAAVPCSDSAKETSSGSLYCWIEESNVLLELINDALGNSKTSAQAREASQRFARIATSSGHTRLSWRMEATREASQKASQAEDELYTKLASESKTPDDPESKAEFRAGVIKQLGSAAHNAAAYLSRTPSRAADHDYMQNTFAETNTTTFKSASGDYDDVSSPPRA